VRGSQAYRNSKGETKMHQKLQNALDKAVYSAAGHKPRARSIIIDLARQDREIERLLTTELGRRYGISYNVAATYIHGTSGNA